jgi:hypothetical protein
MINITKQEMHNIAVSAGLDPDTALTTTWRGIPKRHMPTITLNHSIRLIELGWAIGANLPSPVAFELMGGVALDIDGDDGHVQVIFTNIEVV